MILINDKGAEFSLIDGPILFSDMGPSYTKDGVTYNKVSNGVSFRYAPANGAEIPISVVKTTITDSDVSKVFANLSIPGGLLAAASDTLTISYQLTVAGPSVSSSISMSLVTRPEYSLVNGVVSVTNTGPITKTVSFRLRGNESTVFTFENISSASYTRSPVSSIANIMANVDMAFTSSITAASGVTHTISNLRAVYNTSAIVNPVADTTNYRLPANQWFADDSPWNLPLPPQTIRGDLTHQLALDIKNTRWGSKTNEGGSTVLWASVQKYSGTGPQHIPVYQAKESDPVYPVYVFDAGGVKPHGPYFLKNPTSAAATYKIRLPLGMAPGQVGDQAVVIITPDKRYAIEMGRYSWNDTLKRHECSRLNTIDLYGKGFSQMFTPFSGTTRMSTGLTSESYGYNFYYRAGGNPFMGGIIRKDELDLAVATSSEIPHMICGQTATYILRTARFQLISATGNTIVVKSLHSTKNYVNYTPIFSVVGQKVRITTSPDATGLPVYTTTGTVSYDSDTGYTTFTVNEAIQSYSGSEVEIGSTRKEWYDYSYSWPMTARDSAAEMWAPESNRYIGNIPMGQVFTYPASLDVEALSLTPEAKAVARAIKKYGLMIVDAAGNTNNICQCDDKLTSTQRSNILGNATALFANLVPVLNYDKTLYQQAVADITIPKPKPILPMYTNTP